MIDVFRSTTAPAGTPPSRWTDLGTPRRSQSLSWNGRTPPREHRTRQRLLQPIDPTGGAVAHRDQHAPSASRNPSLPATRVTSLDVTGFLVINGRFGQIESPHQEGSHLRPGYRLLGAIP